MKRLCVINVVGLTPRLLSHAPNLAAVGMAAAWTSPTPAVTCTSQATMLTGLPPREHGIVANGWLFQDTGEIRFWQQSRRLIQGDVVYDHYETAKMFWWFNQATTARYGATPKPHYGCDGGKAFDIIDWTGCELTRQLGPFPFIAFWGPSAGLAASDWIADATAIVLREKRPQLTLCYLPHLDYDYQRFDIHNPDRVAEVDAAAARVIAAAREVDAQVVVVSEYGLTPVQRAVFPNRVLREAGMLALRDGPYGEMLIPGEGVAVAVCDHQLAHVYVHQADRTGEVRRLLETTPGIAAVVPPGDLQLDHPRAGQWIALSEANSWFAYDYWLDQSRAPDFARTVDIHRKPGYDPRELFIASKPRAAFRLAQKKLGFRYRMDVIPLDTSLVRGSHGRQPIDPADGPLIIGPGDPPTSMQSFPTYVTERLS